MKLAVPVKFGRENSPVSPLFGHAKYFAFIDEDEIEVVPNEYDGGMDVVHWLLHRGTGAVIVQHIGKKPFEALQQKGIQVWYAGEGRIELSEALQRLQEGKLLRIDSTNIDQFARHNHHHHHGEHA